MKLKLIGGIAALLFILLFIACDSEDSIEFKRYYSSGALIYQSHCQNCHGANGEGLSALIPPLTDSAYLKNNRAKLPCSIKFGLNGSMTIGGRKFDDVMPANDFSPIELAQVLTYVGNSFGNRLNTINEQMVQADMAKCK